MVKLRKKASVVRRARRLHTEAFKTQAALAARREDKTMAELCEEFGLHAKIEQRTLENDFLERKGAGFEK